MTSRERFKQNHQINQSDNHSSTEYSTIISQQLSLASLELLTHPLKQGKSIEASQRYSNKEGDACYLDWPHIDLDRQILQSVIALLSFANYFNDEVFKKEIFSSVTALLKKTQLFQLLADPEIILTEAHQKNGLNSAEHILKVLSGMPTTYLSHKHKLLLRVFALHHDLGKGISAGLTKKEIQQVFSKQAYQNTWSERGTLKNSFPDHQLTSALIFLSLYEGRAEQMHNELLGEKEIELIAYLIAHHHAFFDFTLSPDQEQYKDWQIFLPGNQAQKELFLAYLFLFHYADANATPVHHQWLKPSVIWMKDVLNSLETLPKNVIKQIQAVISQEMINNQLNAKN